MLDSVLREIEDLRDKARFAESCCDKPEDRIYHAEDGTWWQRIGNCWRAAEPPHGWGCDTANAPAHAGAVATSVQHRKGGTE